MKRERIVYIPGNLDASGIEYMGQDGCHSPPARGYLSTIDIQFPQYPLYSISFSKGNYFTIIIRV